MIPIDCLTRLVFNVKSLLVVVRLSVVLVLLMSLNLFVVAQSAAARPERGIAPANSYAVSDIESVSLTNGNLSLSIPLAALPPMSGGKLSWALRAIYNSKAWDTVRSEIQPDPLDPGSKYTVTNLQLSGVSGWRLGARYEISFQDSDWDYSWIRPANQSQDPEYNLLTQNSWKKVALATPDGATHELRPTDYSPYIDFFGNHPYLRGYYKDNPNTISASMRYYSVDGSRIWVKIDSDPHLFSGNARSWTLYLPDGTKVEQLTSGIQRITDTNGNKVKIWSETDGNGVTTTHYQDELTAREIKYIYNPAGNGGLGAGQMQYQTVGGAWVTIDINFGTTRVQGKIYQIGDAICGDASNLVDQYLIVVRSIVLPLTETGLARKQFTFTYNSDTTNSISQQWRPNCWGGYQTVTTASYGWGSLNRMVTPRGARVDYVYNHDGWHTLGMNPDDAPRESMTAKTIKRDSDGALFGSWTYGVVPNGGSVTNPDGSTVIETMYPYDRAFTQIAAGFGGKEGLTYRTDNSGKVRIERHWTLMMFSGGENIAPGAGTFVTFNPVVDAEYTSLMEGSPPVPVKMSAKTFQYDYNGNLLEEKIYDWFDPALVSRDAQGVPTGVPASATLLRTTTNTFHNDSTASTSANVYSKRAVATGLPLILNALQQTVTGPSQTRFSYDNQAYGIAPTTGNLTKASQWDDQAGAWRNTTITYNSSGNKTSTTDPKGNVTTFHYDTTPYVSPTRVVVDPLNGTGTQTTTFVYDSATGLVTSQTDPNNQTTTIGYTNHRLSAIDPYARPGVVIGPAVTSVANGVTYTNQHHRVKTTYYDEARQVVTESDLNQEDDKKLKSRTSSDELGRPILAESNEDGTANWTISSQNVYIEMGRITMTSNPKRSATTTTDGWTRTTRDGLGRVTEVATFATATQPPNSGTNSNWTGSVTSTYNANETTVADQLGKQRKSVADGLGRLLQVYEDPAGVNHLTSYVYDTLGNLRKVTQGSQQRFFMYDSLSRLIRANNPEQNANSALNLTDPITGNSQWMMKYGYDENGNLTTKVDARNITTTYSYDGLNRNTAVSYSDGVTPAVNRYYDGAISNGKGRLHYSLSYNLHPVSGYAYSITQVNGYDAMGRVTGQQQGFLNSAGTQWHYYPVSRAYNLASRTSSQTYPSNRTISNNYDNAGRLSSFSGNLGDGVSRTYADTFSYTAGGQMLKERFGTTNSAVGGGTGLYHNVHYNNRLQAVDIRLGHYVNDEWNWSRGALITYYSVQARNAGNAFLVANDNNGNVTMAEHYVPTDEAISSYSITLRDTYEYDNLNRLTQTNGVQRNTAGSWFSIYAQWYSYDQWGNRTINNGATWGAGINNLAYTVNSANNRINGVTYDLAGNVTSDPNGVSTATYDAENRMKSALKGGVQSYYVYDADGKRARRIISGVETWQVYGIEGELVAEYPANGSATMPQKEYGYRGGQMLIVGGCDVARWIVADHLGTPRMEVDPSGSLTTMRRHDYLPFGEELLVGMGTGSIRTTGMGYTADCVRQRFTEKERDTETGLDYFINRYFSSVQGRFTSADPISMTSIRPANPQLWNLYGYVGNNPMSHTDPNGLEIFVTGEEAERYRRELEKASGLKLALNQKTGQITIVEKPKTLTDDAKRIVQAIEDKDNKVKINAVNDKEGKLNLAVGSYEGNGNQTIDFADIDALNKGKAISGGSASIVHETIEAYEGLANPTVQRAKTLGLDFQEQYGFAHKEASRYENIYRKNNGLPTFQGGQSVNQPSGGAILYNEYSTHREELTFDKGGKITGIKVEKKP